MQIYIKILISIMLLITIAIWIYKSFNINNHSNLHSEKSQKSDLKPNYISGGSGNSSNQAIIIHKTDLNDYVGIEYAILTDICKREKKRWQIIKQELLSQNGKKIDKLTIQTKKIVNSKILLENECYYFDITECRS